jgi:hypothetical protein
MGYAQPVKSPRGNYYLARYLNEHGKYGTVKDEHAGRPAHFDRKRDAKKAADAAEADVREGRVKAAAEEPARDVLTFGLWASTWYGALALAPSTLENYRFALETRVLPAFQDCPVTETGILPPHVDAWKQQLRAEGLTENTIKTYATPLRACLSAAVAAGIIPSNPAATGTMKGTGRRGVARAAAVARSAEKVITDMLGGFLTAERLAILTGRDDEFVMGLTLQHGMLRLMECVGLEACYVTPGNIHVEWQLAQVRGRLIRDIPKDGSRGDVTVPWFLTSLIGWHLEANGPQACACHGLAYVFGGKPNPRGRIKPGGPSVRDVAAAAGVAPAVVWGVTENAERYPPQVRAAVRSAARELGWLTGEAPFDPEWHWRREEVERLVSAAASGMWPGKGKAEPARAVALAGEWPGTALRGPGSGRRAEWSWMPVARGLTPHSLRHSQRTQMEGDGTPEVLAEAQMRHEQRGLDVYKHVTDAMREDYRERMGEAFRVALLRRLELSPSSPVAVAEMLLREAAGDVPARFLARNSQTGTVSVLRARR